MTTTIEPNAPPWSRLVDALQAEIRRKDAAIEELRAENERLRAEVAAERERCAVTAEECSCECCCTPDEIAMAEYIAGKIREPNAIVSGAPAGAEE